MRRMVTDSHGAPVFAFRRSSASRPRTTTHDNAEQRLQMQVVKFLEYALPKDRFWFTASMAGIRLGKQTAITAKAMGNRPGWPDIQILGAGGSVKFIELKAPGSRESALSERQRAFRDFCRASGKDIWAMCSSLEEVEAQLLAWGVPLACDIRRVRRF